VSHNWPQVRLGELLNYRKDFVTIDDLSTYKRPRVRLHAKGIVQRDEIQGVEIKTKQQQICRSGDFLVAEIDAKVGGFGIVPPGLAGAIVSSHYFLYSVRDSNLDKRFLDYFIRTPAFRDQVEAQGSTNYAAIRPADVFDYAIPLPPLSEQRRIVARIEKLSTRTDEARALSHIATVEAEALHLSVLHQHFVSNASTWAPMPMGEAVEISDKQVDPTSPEFARLPHISGENMESKTCRLLPLRTAEADGVRSNNYLFAPGTILYSKIRPYLRKAVFADFRGVCSADVYPIRVKSLKLDAQFVKWALVAEPFMEYANRLSGRTRMPKLNRRQLFAFPFSHPSPTEQRRIVAELDALQAKVDEVKKLQAETRAELDALLPSILDRAFKGEL
jgi:type I restriction enzyme S subunit